MYVVQENADLQMKVSTLEKDKSELISRIESLQTENRELSEEYVSLKSYHLAQTKSFNEEVNTIWALTDRCF